MSTLETTIAPATNAPADEALEPRADGVAGFVTDVLSSTDHKVASRDLAGVALIGTAAAALCGLLLALDRINGDGTVLSADVVPQLLNGYRVGLIFGGIAPLLLAICAFAVPLQVGARSLAFPRFASLGGWTWFGGLVLFIVSLAADGGGGGEEARMVWLSILALGLMAAGLIAIAIPIATTVLTTRAPGMRLSRVPFFSWSALVFALGLALSLPVLIGTLAYVYVGNRYGTGIMAEHTDVMRRAWWFLTGPALALFAVPVVGFFVEIVGPTFRKRVPMRSAALTGIALVGAGGLAAVMQQRSIRLPGDITDVSSSNFGTKFGELVVWALFSLLPLLGVLVAFGALALTAKPDKDAASRAPKPAAPALFALLGFGLVAVGLLANAANGIVDLGLIGTVFEEGATVAIVYGGVLSAIGAGIWWLPKLSGRTISTGAASGLALLGAAGAALASLPYLIAGFLDQPQVALFLDTPQIDGATDVGLISTTWANDGPGELLNLLATAGHAALALTALGFLALAVRSLTGAGDAAEADAWGGGQTLEWSTPSPAPADNFAVAPTVSSPEPVLDATAYPDDLKPALEEAK